MFDDSVAFFFYHNEVEENKNSSEAKRSITQAISISTTERAHR
jgi:hypothetical protein